MPRPARSNDRRGTDGVGEDAIAGLNIAAYDQYPGDNSKLQAFNGE
jgi:hypothetical protein